MDDLKIEYNKLLASEKKGEAYLNDDSIPGEERDKHIQRFRDIAKGLSKVQASRTAKY